MSDGYSSNMGRCVNIAQGRFFGLKSHDCHVFMECLLPIAFRELPNHVQKPLTKLSEYFIDLCSSTRRVNDLLVIEKNNPTNLCKLERIFPLEFFDSMEHLLIHLVYETRVCGPVQHRRMYPFEREIGGFKRIVKIGLELRDQYTKHTFRKRFQIFVPITLSLIFNLEELGLAGMTMEMKVQLSQHCPYST